MDLLKPQTRPLPGTNRTPTGRVEGLGAGNEHTFFLQGPDGGAFGITQPLFYSDSPEDIAIREISVRVGESAEKNKLLDRPGTSLRAVQRYFRDHRLDAPLIVESKHKLRVVVENRDSSAHDVEVALQGLTEKQLEARKTVLKKAYGTVPEPHLTYGLTNVSANAANVPLGVLHAGTEHVFDRMAVATRGPDGQITVRVRSNFATAIEEQNIELFTRRFDGGRTAAGVYTISPTANVNVEATNDDGSAHDVSTFFVTYPRTDVEAIL